MKKKKENKKTAREMITKQLNEVELKKFNETGEVPNWFIKDNNIKSKYRYIHYQNKKRRV